MTKELFFVEKDFAEEGHIENFRVHFLRIHGIQLDMQETRCCVNILQYIYVLMNLVILHAPDRRGRVWVQPGECRRVCSGPASHRRI